MTFPFVGRGRYIFQFSDGAGGREGGVDNFLFVTEVAGGIYTYHTSKYKYKYR